MRALSAIMAAILLFVVFSSVFLVLDGRSDGEEIDGVVYDEAVFQKYADRRYYEAFQTYGGVEDNILIVFLANRANDKYYCITWVGDNLRESVVLLFGDETTDFGMKTVNTVQDYYAYSLDTDFISIVGHMTESVERLSLPSPFITDFDVDLRPESYLINHTEIELDKYAVSASLEEFTRKTGIPMVINVDYMDNVFNAPSFDSDRLVGVVFLVICGIVASVIIYREIAECKRLEGKKLHVPCEEEPKESVGEEKSESEESKEKTDTPKDEPREKKKKQKDSKYGKDYDKSRYNKKI